MILICWLRRTGATTWRSFPPLQMIIAIIIVMFYSIFFCCSIWTLIRVCVGHTPRHSTSIIPLPHTSRGLTWLPAQTSTCTLASVDASASGEMGLREGGGLRNHVTSWTSIESSTLPPLQCTMLSAFALYIQFFIAVESWLCPFLTHLTPGYLVLLGCVATHFPLGVTRHFLCTAKNR